MARGEHRPSCAKSWREQARAEGWSAWQTVQAIRHCCGVSLLKAHRLARGWTAVVAVHELQELCRREHLAPPKISIDLLNSWENGRSRPQPETIDRLARLYKSNAIRLGFASDYGDDEAASPPALLAIPPRGELSNPARSDLAAPSGTPSSVLSVDSATVFYQTLRSADQPEASLFVEVERLRRAMDRTLAMGTATEDQMDRMDETVLQLRRDYLVTPPLPMLCQLMLEFTDVQSLAAHRQRGPIQRRLSHVAAVLAVLAADALMKLGDLRQARSWYGTAKAAADDTGDPRLRALVRAQEAMLPYYYGDLGDAVRLAAEAQSIARAIPCSPAALAAAAEGRARARLGDHGRAGQALSEAQRVFSKIRTSASADLAFDFTEERLYLYLSGAHAHMPDARQARAVQEHALALCRKSTVPSIDPALVTLDRAASLARGGEVVGACVLAEQALLDLPSEHRTSIVFVRARDVRRLIGPGPRPPRELRRLDEVLGTEPTAPDGHSERLHG
ncbi:helix-turn-helix domain-containing protein [Spirillospora sp. CA-253888]